jgi:hypothetical protein
VLNEKDVRNSEELVVGAYKRRVIVIALHFVNAGWSLSGTCQGDRKDGNIVKTTAQCVCIVGVCLMIGTQ